MVSFPYPYHSHISRDSYGSGMGIVWQAYHKGVPLLGVPENSIDLNNPSIRPAMKPESFRFQPGFFAEISTGSTWVKPPSRSLSPNPESLEA